MIFNLSDKELQTIYKALTREQGNVLCQLEIETHREPFHPRSEKLKVEHHVSEAERLRQEYAALNHVIHRLMKEL